MMALVFPQVNRIIYEVTSVLVEQPRGEGESTLTKIERKIVGIGLSRNHIWISDKQFIRVLPLLEITHIIQSRQKLQHKKVIPK